MIFLIFPKVFEYNKFLLTLAGGSESGESTIIYANRICYKDIHYDVVTIKLREEASNYTFFCKLIDDSDVGFLLKFNQFVKRLQDQIHNEIYSLQFLIIGTCGMLKVIPPICPDDNNPSPDAQDSDGDFATKEHIEKMVAELLQECEDKSKARARRIMELLQEMCNLSQTAISLKTLSQKMQETPPGFAEYIKNNLPTNIETWENFGENAFRDLELNREATLFPPARPENIKELAQNVYAAGTVSSRSLKHCECKCKTDAAERSQDVFEHLGNAYYINEAVKYDRGILVQGKDDGIDMRFRLDHREFKRVRDSLMGRKRCILSSNFLHEGSEIDRNLLNKTSSENDEFVLADMETWDFMNCCSFNNLICLGAIRVVSDYDRGIFKKECCPACVAKSRKIMRRLCHFGEACEKFIALLKVRYRFFSSIDIAEVEKYHQAIMDNTSKSAANSALYSFISKYPATAASAMMDMNLSVLATNRIKTVLVAHRLSLSDLVLDVAKPEHKSKRFGAKNALFEQIARRIDPTLYDVKEKPKFYAALEGERSSFHNPIFSVEFWRSVNNYPPHSHAVVDRSKEREQSSLRPDLSSPTHTRQ